MRKVFIGALLLVTAGMANTTKAEEFSKLVEKLKQHPEVAAYQSKAESLKHYSKGELGLPDPMLFIEEQDYPIGSSMSKDFEQKMIGFKQEIPRYKTRKSASDKVGAEARKNELLAAYAFANLKAKLITNLADLEKTKQIEKILSEQYSLLKSEEKSVKGRIAANRATQSQFSLVNAEASQVEIMKAELKEEGHGVTYEATISEEGVIFQGRQYKSLSEVARTITGVRWSGPAFFGLKGKVA